MTDDIHTHNRKDRLTLLVIFPLWSASMSLNAFSFFDSCPENSFQESFPFWSLSCVSNNWSTSSLQNKILFYKYFKYSKYSCHSSQTTGPPPPCKTRYYSINVLNILVVRLEQLVNLLPAKQNIIL